MVCRYEKKTEFLPGKRKARAETGRRRIMKIAIMTFYQEDNYGTVLQAAALSRYLTQLGHQADLIQYVSDGRIQTIHKDSAASDGIILGESGKISSGAACFASTNA